MKQENTNSGSWQLIDRHFYIENLGCAKNQVDAEIMISSLETSGFVPVEKPEDAGLIIINTCGFIEEAKKESIDTLFSYRNLFPDRKILLAGCFAQRYGEELFATLKEADAVFGNRDPSSVVKAAERLINGERFLFLPEEGCIGGIRNSLLSHPGSAYIKIAEGCSHFCSYCAIPLIRGTLRSRARPEIVEEARQLLSRGILELNLVAQDLASFGTDRTAQGEFLSLVSDLSSLPGDFWVRLLYIHPDTFPSGLIDVIEKQADNSVF